MALACAIWGVMAPLAKDAMVHGLAGFTMVWMRVAGAAALFWITDIVLMMRGSVQHERVSTKEVFRFFLASIIGVAINQSCFTIGVSLTSPIHATLMTTTLPIISLLIAVIFLGEKLRWQKIMGIVLGLSGALTLILSNLQSQGFLLNGSLSGDLLCILAQCSFATYLVVFKSFIRRHSVITCMKWMMLFAAIVLLPFAAEPMLALDWTSVPLKSYWEAAYVVFFGTYISYILMTYAQKMLQPTVVAMYNYVQPIVATCTSLVLGIAVFGWHQALAVVCIFVGVWLVTQQKTSN